jgi:hypothetical protein
VMNSVEQERLLMWIQLLDTEKGSLAEFVYPRLGYVKVNDVLWNIEEMLMRCRLTKSLDIRYRLLMNC